MSLGKKIIGIFLVLGAALCAGSYVALQLTIFPAFEAVERNSAIQDLDRVLRILDDDLHGLEIVNMEYSLWDQTYDFARGLRPEYVDENIDPAYWHSVESHMMLFYDADGHLLAGHLSDPVDGTRLDLDDEMLSPLERGHPLVTHDTIKDSVKGVLQTRSGILQVVSYPILTSDGNGPIAGSLVTGQFISDQRIADLRERAGAGVALLPIVDGQLPANLGRIGDAVLRATSPYIADDNDDIRSYRVLRNVLGEAVAVLEVTSPRTVTRLGTDTMHTAMWFIASAGALFLIAALLFLRRLIIAPVQSLTNTILGIRRATDLNIESEGFRSDEIGVLAREFGAFARRLGRTQRELEEARDDAVDLSKAKSEFLARMSHEIRTPMNGVLGMTELLSNTALTPKQKRFVKTIYESAESLLTIINDILDFSKIEAGKLRLESIDLDLRSLVEETLDALADEAHRKGLELISVLPPDMPTAVRSDPIRLRQVLTNLVSNAVKFTERGEVAVRLNVIPADDGFVDVALDIVDTGVGISPEKQAAIFDAFTQEDGSTTRLYGGTGLGLAISKQIIELLGGTLSVSSAPGCGSTFSVALRLPPAESLPRSEKGGLQCIAGKRILIVDDNATNREILELHLESWRARTDSVPGALQAMQILEAAVAKGQPHDLAILDMNMPHTDGIGLARLIRGNPDMQKLRLIILSSIAAPAGEDVLAELDIAGQLTKPVRQSELYDALISVMSDGTVSVRHLGFKRREVRSLRGTILLAEDNAVNQAVGVGMLETLGVSVAVASNGLEAVDQASSVVFDAILMDCQMPDLDGFGATRAIRHAENEASREPVPIIAVTANALRGDREKCMAAGMNDYLSKPYTIEQLHAVLAPFLQTGGSVITGAPAISEPDDQAPIDRRALEILAELQDAGDSNLLQKVVNVYLESSVELRERLEDALAAANDDDILESAHALKSCSANVGALRLAELCRLLENMAREKDLDGADAVHVQLRDEYERVIAALRAELEVAA